jgi:hypothetical protein
MFIPKKIKFKQIRKGNLQGMFFKKKTPYIGKFGIKATTLGKMNINQMDTILLFLKKNLNKTNKI